MNYANRRFLLNAIIPLTAVAGMALLACSDDGPSTPEPAGPVTTVEKTIPPTGGSLAVENEDGVVLTVQLPSGAVLEPTRVTLRAVTPRSGVQARFAIEPAGLRLLVPATYTVTLPDGARFGPTFGLSFENGERVYVPTEVDMGARTLRATIYQLGFVDPTTALQSTSAQAAGALNPDDFINVEEMQCQIVRDALTDQILRAQAFSGPFPPDLASPLIQEYRAALLVCESDDSVAAASEVLREYACSNVASAEREATTTIVTSVEELRRTLGFLLAAEGMAQVFGAECSVQASTMEAEFDQYLNAYIDRINDPGFTRSFPTWDALWRENITVVGLAALAQEYAVQGAVDKINDEVFPALFARLHEVARTACEQDENNTFLLDIVTGGHTLNHPIIAARELPAVSGLSQPEVVDEMLTCGSSVTAEARTADNEILDTDNVGLDDGEGSVRVIRGGKVVLTSDILGFTCNGIVTRPPIRVRAEVPNNLPVVQLGTLSAPLTVNIASTVASLPEVENEAPRNFDIVIERDRNVCGVEGAGVLELARISVNTHGFSGQTTGTWSGGCPSGGVSGTFSITILDDGTVMGTYEGSASGGISGTVLSNGTFDASANGTAGPCTWSGSMSIAGGLLSGSGSWSCDVGCSGSYASTPPVTLRR